MKLHYVDITYYSTLYNRPVTERTHNEITFKDGSIYFKAGGHGYAIPFERVISITPIEED